MPSDELTVEPDEEREGIVWVWLQNELPISVCQSHWCITWWMKLPKMA